MNGPNVNGGLNSSTQSIIRENLRRLRQTRGWSLADVSNRMRGEMTPVMLNRVELGTRRLTASEAVALAVVFGVSPIQILLPWPQGDDKKPYTIDGATGEQSGVELQLWGMGRSYPQVLSPWLSSYEGDLLTAVHANPDKLAHLASSPNPDTLARLVEGEALDRLKPLENEVKRCVDAVDDAWSREDTRRAAASRSFWGQENRQVFAEHTRRFLELRDEAGELMRSVRMARDAETFDARSVLGEIAAIEGKIASIGAALGAIAQVAGIEIASSISFQDQSRTVLKWTRWADIDDCTVDGVHS